MGGLTAQYHISLARVKLQKSELKEAEDSLNEALQFDYQVTIDSNKNLVTVNCKCLNIDNVLLIIMLMSDLFQNTEFKNSYFKPYYVLLAEKEILFCHLWCYKHNFCIVKSRYKDHLHD